MIMIPQERAVNILAKMSSEIDKWEFKPYIAESGTEIS